MLKQFTTNLWSGCVRCRYEHSEETCICLFQVLCLGWLPVAVFALFPLYPETSYEKCFKDLDRIRKICKCITDYYSMLNNLLRWVNKCFIRTPCPYFFQRIRKRKMSTLLSIWSIFILMKQYSQ